MAANADARGFHLFPSLPSRAACRFDQTRYGTEDGSRLKEIAI